MTDNIITGLLANDGAEKVQPIHHEKDYPMTKEQSSESITLYYRDGGSDKVYTARIEAAEGGHVVNFAFGRRGNTLQTGTKTPKPVDYDTARKAYDKLVREKMAKGYTPGEDGTPYQHTSKEERATGIFPQLLNPIDEDQALRLIEDPDWWSQEKFDGKRILLRKDGDQVAGINRKGVAVALPHIIVEQARTISGPWLMDGEAVGDTYFAFDLLERAGVDFWHESYNVRLAGLYDMLGPGDKCPIRFVKTAYSAAQKNEMLAQLRRDRREGIVFKRSSAPYTPGRPASGGTQLKLKFTATASCIVAKASKTKRSVALELLDGDRRVGVGNVTIPGKAPIPAAGSVIEVRYLYCAGPGGSLYQPVYLGQRDDISTEACILGQLKYKAGDEENDA